MGPIWGPSGADRTQVGPMLAPWTLQSGTITNITPPSHVDCMINKSVVIRIVIGYPVYQSITYDPRTVNSLVPGEVAVISKEQSLITYYRISLRSLRALLEFLTDHFWLWVNNDASNDFMLSGNKSLPGPMCYVAKGRHLSLISWIRATFKITYGHWYITNITWNEHSSVLCNICDHTKFHANCNI